ncbi:EamA family transporter [Desulfohalobiaceae bacterium Ax17]|uniref:EamA family transporter n=1 Tax=Desulfovulcanus ferrireducens TaxID=2831190 RepID=UPI00207B9EDF|nr:EamA family transporter [Desulfovulcanus ferrireducens]MBT8763619.1 EamA family transporter [Desulfovulcanus ferrireducens]
MNIQALFFIFISALFHMGWNLCVKNSPQKQIFIWWMFVTTLILFLPLALWHLPIWKTMPLSSVFACLGASLMYSFYQLCTGKAYQKGELSLVYPLTNLTPLFVPIWASWFLGEYLSLSGITGIFLTTFGAILLQWERKSTSSSKQVKKDKKPVFWALAASLFASIGSVFDKAGVDRLSAPLVYPYITLMIFFMLSFLSIVVWKKSSSTAMLAEIKKLPGQIFLGGVFLAGSVLFFRYGMKVCPISYAVALRKAGIVLSVWLGAIIYRESQIALRTVASVIIVVGILLLRM